jgi:ATP-dependent helicase/nuclease subunit A
LTSEFTAGHGAHAGTVTRTMFAVGDQKQSIYGFQGAAPEQFDAVRRDLGRKIREAGQRFNAIELPTSFRSVPDIVGAVDAIFTPREHWAGLTFADNVRPQLHDTARINGSGAVDIWDIAADDVEEDNDAWSLPLDAPERQHGNLRLARQIATLIRRWSDAGQDDLGRAFAPGDVLILLRNRTTLFETIVKALKDAGVPVAGRDRLKLAVHPAVEDLIVLGRAILLPEDDLALATLLRTPLFDMPHEQLQDLAAGRSGSLRKALREAAAESDLFARINLQLDHAAALSSRSGPFGFFAHVLGPLNGRREAIHRLGPEAGDAVDAFLSAALEFERRHGPSLFAFLEAMSGSTQDIKRDLSAASREVRVMTVHGAKGLESRVVILADVGVPPGPQKGEKLLGLAVPGEVGRPPVPVWSPNKGTDAEIVAAAKANALAKAREEHNRLLYVALTRAEERLIVCGATPKGDAPVGSWYETITRGLSESATGLRDLPQEDGNSVVRRFRITTGHASAPPEQVVAALIPAMPDWLNRAAPAEQDNQPPLSPSHAVGAADQPERALDTAQKATAIGRLGHLLLQILPAVALAKRPAAASALLAVKGAGLTGQQRQDIAAQALALLAKPDLAAFFGPAGLAEVPVTGKVRLGVGEAQLVSGQIDRLLISDSSVIIADFKTGARPPTHVSQVPRQMLVQMALYRALIADMFPGKLIRTLLIFTADLSVHEPDEAQLAQALADLATNRAALP